MKRCVIYARVSTEDQNLDNQLLKLREFVKMREWLVVEEIFEKESGRRSDRPGYLKLMELARKRKIDLVCVYKFDRFSRSARQLIESMQEFSELGIEFVSYMENIDTSTASGRMFFQICAAFAEFEVSNMRERIHAGLDRAVKQGKTLGRKATVMVDWEQLKSLRLTHSVRKTAKIMGISHSAVQRATLAHKLQNAKEV